MAQAFLFKLKTKNGYLLNETVSALQKSIRRSDEETALFFALELFPTYAKYCWKRLQVVSVEDIEDPNAAVVVNAMRDAFFFNNEGIKKAEDFRNRIFITKAVLYLCRCVKSREADNAQHFIDTLKNLPIPKYSLDLHTKKGRQMGKTKDDFFIDEQKALNPKGKDCYFKKLTLG